VFLRLFENTCHTTRAVGQTLKEKENYFWYFLKISATRCERSDRHNKVKENIFCFFRFFIFSIFFLQFLIIFKYLFFLEIIKKNKKTKINNNNEKVNK